MHFGVSMVEKLVIERIKLLQVKMRKGLVLQVMSKQISFNLLQSCQ